MTKTFSFLKDFLNWVGRGLLSSWRVSKFSFFPTEKNLLVSFWYDYDYYKRIRPDDTVYDFLDLRVMSLQEQMEEPNCKLKIKRLYRYLLKALQHSRPRATFIAFLESPAPEEHYQPMILEIRSIWRMENVPVEEGSKEALPPEVLVVEGGEQDGIRLLNAKTYFIAAELHFELAGKEEDFTTLSLNMPELMTFVKGQFGVGKLPGTFDKLKGYTYKIILTGRNDAKKGQLKPHFRQIVENPQVFGDGIVMRARKILDKQFD